MTDITMTRSGPVATLCFSRPAVLNAFRAETRAQFGAALEETGRDAGVRVLIITGAGRAFSAGQDLRELDARMAAGHDGQARFLDDLEELQDLTRALRAMPQVTIAALNGVAVGLGAELALACDIRLAAESAAMGFLEVKRGLFETNGVMYLLPRLIGLSRATELLLSGRLAPAEECADMGLVHRVHSDEDLSAQAREMADSIAAHAPMSIRLVKELLRDTFDLDLGQVMRRETEGMTACLHSSDLREGTRAFLDGRPPVYEGR